MNSLIFTLYVNSLFSAFIHFKKIKKTKPLKRDAFGQEGISDEIGDVKRITKTGKFTKHYRPH